MKRRHAFTINPADAERLQSAIEQNGSLTDGEVAQVHLRKADVSSHSGMHA